MPSYKTKAIVLRKTKLRDVDLIITFLAEDGSKRKCVARSARKPGSTFSSRLDLFRVSDLLLHTGKSLDVVTEARASESFDGCRSDVLRGAFGCVVLELAEAFALEGQGDETLFPMTLAALRAASDAAEACVPAVAAAYAFKAGACQGFAPSFDRCAICGRELKMDARDVAGFSVAEGGVVCAACSADLPPDRSFVFATWALALLKTRFADMEALLGCEAGRLSQELLDFSAKWLSAHMGIELRSIPYASSLISL